MAKKIPDLLSGAYKFEVPERYQLLIGKVIIEWSRAEQAIEELIWAYLKLSIEEGRIITSPLDEKYKISMLRGLGIRRSSIGLLKEFHKVIKLLRNLYEHRSTIAHGNWVTLPNGKYAALSLKLKVPEEVDQRRTNAVSYADDQLTRIITQCVMCRNYLIDLRNKVSGSPCK